MDQSEIKPVRALLSAKPRPVGWTERRQRLDEMGQSGPLLATSRLSRSM
jgi:epsilon-lactone hydrolase